MSGRSTHYDFITLTTGVYIVNPEQQLARLPNTHIGRKSFGQCYRKIYPPIHPPPFQKNVATKLKDFWAW